MILDKQAEKNASFKVEKKKEKNYINFVYRYI